MNKLHIDIETYSSVNIKTDGLYKYCESPDFEILMIAYAYNDMEIEILDIANGDEIPDDLILAMLNESNLKLAHNATFERIAFSRIGIHVPIEQWECSMVKAAYCGLPLGLGQISKALELEEEGKLASGNALIKYFCVPNKDGSRNLPEDDVERWEEFKLYCIGDVRAERAITKHLSRYKIPEFEKINYIVDQTINDRGIRVDETLVRSAFKIDKLSTDDVIGTMKEITGLENPNSPSQLKTWLGAKMNKEIKSLAKDILPKLIKEADSDAVKRVIKLRQKSSKASVKKYTSMLNCLCTDKRVHGLFQFYGASRTGRWSGRLVQLQNLPRNMMADLDDARATLIDGDYDLMDLLYNNVQDILSQLVRTAFIPPEGKTFAVADFSAIEARVVAWIANEKWRLDVFNSHGKIYEASASKMFNVPIETVTKGSELRSKGKNAELALGYQGAVGAMVRLGADKMGMTELEMKGIVHKWRGANRAIVQLWHDFNNAVLLAYKTKKKIVTQYRGIAFSCDDMTLRIHLPSGRCLTYYDPSVITNRFGSPALAYKGIDQVTKKWTNIDTYGGKLVENVTQAISRDILADSMVRLEEYGYPIVLHVHDEVAVEINEHKKLETLKHIEDILGEDIPWAKDLPLKAEGYVTPFYKKD